VVAKDAEGEAHLSKYHSRGCAQESDFRCGMASHITSKAMIFHRVPALVNLKHSASTFGLKHVDRIVQLPTIELRMSLC